MAFPPTPPRLDPAPEPADADLELLMSEPFASAWAIDAPAPADDAPRRRLLARVAAAKAAAAAMFTVRARQLARVDAGTGVRLGSLYAAPAGRKLRAGEPLRARLVELQPGACWIGPGPAQQREWLLLQGSASVGGSTLQPRDYRLTPAGHAAETLSSAHGALVFLRESLLPASDGGEAFTVHDADADWPAFAPGIRRRVLWQHGGQAALLYLAEPGAAVPAHRHGHDEECLLVQGELFLDDILLQAGDYQLAPAGSGHRRTETDRGAILYAHGDLDLQAVA